jgi:hypothetical protein
VKKGKKASQTKRPRQPENGVGIGAQRPAFISRPNRTVTGNPLALVRISHEQARGERKK